MLAKKLLHLVVLLVLIHLDLTLSDPLVVLPDGQIRGREAITLNNQTFYAFEQIPYAAPPIGQLRFKPPQPPQPWNGVLNTTRIGISCFQESVSEVGPVSEDCLYINVYTPKLPSSDDELLPVMVYIHGGGFANGSSLEYPGDRIVEKNLVYVNFNYRLGVFGFLSTQDEVIPGNYALKDQHLALKWVHTNVKLFGGDPDKITVFGESAGSASVGYHLLNQKNQGLFRGAMMQSGSSISPWAYQRNARKIAFSTAAFLDANVAKSDNSTDLLNLLQSVSAEELRDAARNFKYSVYSPQTEPMFNGLFWSPVIEPKSPEAFITNKMYGLLEAGNVVKVPLVIGMTSEESLGLYTADEEFLKIYLGAYDQHLDWLVSNDTGLSDSTSRINLGTKIREMYTGGKPFLDHLGDGVRFFSDSGFTRSSIKHAELHSKVAPTYFYQFSYDGPLAGNSAQYDGAETVGHAEDIFYIFCGGGWSCDLSGYPESDQVMVERMIELWTNFAKFLNPTPEASDLLQNVTWPTVTEEFAYLDINVSLTVKNHPKATTYEEWTEIYSSLNFTDFDTY